jgi:hypothetical protein
MSKLTKSKFKNYLACPREFWLAYHHPEVFESAITTDVAFRIRQGYEVERYLKEFLPSRGDAEYVFQKAVETERLVARFDIFIENGGDGGAHIYEVKSSKHKRADDPKAKNKREEYLCDLAFQVFAAREVGLRISRAFLIMLNGKYVRQDELDLDELFVIEDVTADVESLQEFVSEKIVEAFALLNTEPSAGFEDLCSKKLACEYLRFALPDFPLRTISEIPRLAGAKFSGLLELGILDLFDVPDDYDLTPNQREFIDFVKAGVTKIDKNAISAELERLEYPLYFLDYETVNPAIPQFAGMSPLQHFTFQYSLHIQETRDSELLHYEFLSDGNGVPPRNVASHLAAAIGPTGSILVWYKSFESGRNTEMGTLYPELADFFTSINERVFDLYEIFSKKLYRHPEFKNNSLKSVLPIIAPDLSYDALEIGNGGAALSFWFDRVYRGEDPAEKDRTMNALREYCRLDTLAMVRILDHLQNL